MDNLANALNTVRQLHDTPEGRAWRALLNEKYEQLKERLVFEGDRDQIGAQALLIHELLTDTQPSNVTAPTARD